MLMSVPKTGTLLYSYQPGEPELHQARQELRPRGVGDIREVLDAVQVDKGIEMESWGEGDVRPQAEDSLQEGVQVREALVRDVDEVRRVPEIARAPLEHLLARAEVDRVGKVEIDEYFLDGRSVVWFRDERGRAGAP